MAKKRENCRSKRISTRVSVAEWRLLSIVAQKRGFATVSDMMRDVLGEYCSNTLTLLSEHSRRDNIGAEIEAMFRHYGEDSDEWGPDINKRK